MAGGTKAVFVAVLIAMLAATAPPLTESVVTCDSVVNSLTPCTPYLTKGGKVPETCCNGVKSLYKDADTTADRQMACRCMEQAATTIPGLNIKYARNLPENCNVHIPYKMSPTFNCSMIQ